MIRYPIAALALAFLAAAPGSAPRPGRWDVTVHPNAIPIPASIGGDAGQLFRKMMTQPVADKLCVKRREAGDGTPFLTFRGDKACTASAVTMAGGKLTGSAQCTESGQTMQATLAGSYTAATISYDVTRVSGGLDKPGTVMAHVDAVRGGSCG